jgi:hypothetical protein
MSHPDFKPVETPWGVQHLHTSRKVWYAHYPAAQLRDGTRGKWVAYFGAVEDDKPWCSNNWAITNQDLATEQQAIDACLEHLS